MDSLIFELQIAFYFLLFLSANVRHSVLTEIRDELNQGQINACMHGQKCFLSLIFLFDEDKLV